MIMIMLVYGQLNIYDEELLTLIQDQINILP